MEYPKIEKDLFNIGNENLKKLLSLFPSAIKDGQLDVDILKEEVGQFEEIGQEKYELNWAGKQDAKKEALKNIQGKTLRYIKGDGIQEDTTQNLYIEGDNLEVLKLLRKNYYGQIKMIYIDPPYNTGKDFIYNDNYTMSQSEIETLQGERDEYGERLQINSSDSAKYHTRWLNMMYPRLKLGRDLLKEDGFMCISINDIELHNLKSICDEIFGVENFVNIVSIKSATTASFRAINACPVNVAEYLLIYSKTLNAPINPLYTKSEYSQDYSHIITNYEDDSSCWVLESLDDFVLKNNNVKTRQEYKQLKGDDWKNIRYQEKKEIAYRERHRVVSLNTMQRPSNEVQAIIDLSKKERNKIFKIEREDNAPIYAYNGRTLAFFSKKFKEIDGKMVPAEIITNIWTDISYLSLGKEGSVNYSNGKKPIALISRLCELFTNDNDIIMDYFSGSASCAHSVLDVNQRKMTKRKYIMVQIPECLDNSLNKTSDQTTKKQIKKAIEFLDEISKPHKITELGKERIRQAGQKIKEKIEQENSQLKAGEEFKKLPDIGFKVFRVEETTLNWEKLRLRGEDITLDYLPNTSDKDKLDFTPNFQNDLNVVYEIMLRQEGLPLTSAIEKLTDIGKRTYLVSNNYLISLEESITSDMVEKLSALNPAPFKFVFRDSAFNDDISLKDETFRKLNALIDKNTREKKKTYTVEFI